MIGIYLEFERPVILKLLTVEINLWEDEKDCHTVVLQLEFLLHFSLQLSQNMTARPAPARGGASSWRRSSHRDAGVTICARPTRAAASTLTSSAWKRVSLMTFCCLQILIFVRHWLNVVIIQDYFSQWESFNTRWIPFQFLLWSLSSCYLLLLLQIQ